MVRTLSILEKKKLNIQRKNYNSQAQMKIQQMAFMIVAVFFFFILVGLFFLSWQSKSLEKNYEDLQKQQAITFIEVISDMPEFNCESQKSLCLDEDKLNLLAGNFTSSYDSFWPVASIKVYKIHPSFADSGKAKCPAFNCNYWEIYDSGQKSNQQFAGYVNICKKISHTYTKCEIGKLVVGSRLIS